MTRNGLENNGPKSVSLPSSRFRLWVPSRTCQTCRGLLLFADSRGFSALENTYTFTMLLTLSKYIYICVVCTAPKNQLSNCVFLTFNYFFLCPKWCGPRKSFFFVYIHSDYYRQKLMHIIGWTSYGHIVYILVFST